MDAESSKPGELALLQQIRARASGLKKGGLRLGIGDDCALLRVRAGEEMAVTTDLAIEGRHFRLGWHPAASVGHRTLARGLSDLAAMGARPVAAFLSLGLPRGLVANAAKAGLKKGRQAGEKTWLEGFLDGFFALAERCETPLAGGDLAESPIAMADVVLTGAVARGRAMLRSGARPGDQIYVTGTLGGAARGIAALAEWAETAGESDGFLRGRQIPQRLEALLRPHLFPQPRVAQGLWLAGRGLATAAIDLSDGLSTDLAHLCEESQVAAEVNAAALPIEPGATLAQALHGGEDYELLFTAPPAAQAPRRIAGVAVTHIGRIVRARKGRAQVTLAGANGMEPLAPKGWEHFS